jgi:hypothetical protein
MEWLVFSIFTLPCSRDKVYAWDDETQNTFPWSQQVQIPFGWNLHIYFESCRQPANSVWCFA